MLSQRARPCKRRKPYTDLWNGKYLRDQKTVYGDTHAGDIVTITDSDRFGRVCDEYVGGVCFSSYDYDKLGNKVGFRDGKTASPYWTVTWRYDHAGRVTHKTHDPFTIETSFDELGN